MSKKQGKSFWEQIKNSAQKPFQTWKKEPKKDKKPSPEQGGASSTSGTVASGVAGCSGESKQAHHEQGPKQVDVRTSTSGGIAGASGGSKQVHYEKGRYLDTGVSEGSMVQRLKLRKRLQERTAKHGVPPPLSIKLTKMSDLPKKFKPWSDDHLPVDILLLTTEDCEFLACYTYMKNAFKSYHKDVGIVYFGNMGESEEEPLKVALMRCSEGSSGPGGSQTVTKDAVMQLRPKAIYSVGCCEGLNPEDTNLGDVVVSSKLTTETFKTPVGRDIANLIKNAADGWNPPLKSPEGQEVQVHCDSEILSGIDPVSTERHHQLNPHAIAVETEGKGIFVAAHDLKIEWVIVKGISHFADESNAPDKSWKSHACVMAASLVSNMLHAVVFEDWPHYEDIQSVQKESSTSKGKEDKHADSAWLSECQRQLQTIYTATNKIKIVPWDQSSAVHIDQIYTALSWLKDNREPSGVKREKIKNYTHIFTSGKHSQAPKRILVYGRPGIGKTVFTQKTTFDWAKQRFKEKLGTFELVLLVKLRHVRNFEDVPSLLRDAKLLAADGEISVDELYHYVRDHQEKVLIILDGYDENSAINQSPVREIWERRQLRDCCVVITTRHMKADELRRHSDAQFEINGFDRKRQVEFARRFLKDEEDVEAFLRYLEQQDLEEIAEIPLLLLMLCLLWQEKGKDQKELPTSRAKIFSQFIQTFFDHLFEKYSDAVVTEVDAYTDELCKLGSLAFDALLLERLHFPLSKLPDHDFIKKLIDVGLFHISNISSLNRDQGVYFLHKSVQEYLAGWFLKEELLSKKSENTPSLESINSIEKILKMDEVFKFACEMSEKAATAILTHLGMVAKKGLTEYSFIETPSHWHLSDEQRNFLRLCGQCFFFCSAETRRDVFPAFLSYTQDVLLLTNSSQLHIIANEHLLKTTESPNYIFFSYEDSKHLEEDYYKFTTIVEDLNAVVVSCSGEEKASEFLKKYRYRSVNEFFLKTEQNTYLFFAKINPPFPTEMLKELITAPESTAQKNTKDEDKQSSEQDNRTGLFFTKDSDSTSCSAHCLSMVWDIDVDVDRSEMEVLTDVIPLVIAPRVIGVSGKTGEWFDAQLTETLVTRINYTNRLELLLLHNINLTAKSAAIISNSLHKVPNLGFLHLSWNPLGEGVSVLSKHLRCVPHLERLELYYVMMTKEQVHDLTTAVRQSNISDLVSDYHDTKGNPKPEHKWPSERYWKRRYRSLFPDSSSEKNEERNSDSEEEWPIEDLDWNDSSSESEEEQEQDEEENSDSEDKSPTEDSDRNDSSSESEEEQEQHDPQFHHHHASQSGGPSMSPQTASSARLTHADLGPLPHASQSDSPSMSPEIARSARPLPDEGNLEPEQSPGLPAESSSKSPGCRCACVIL